MVDLVDLATVLDGGKIGCRHCDVIFSKTIDFPSPSLSTEELKRVPANCEGKLRGNLRGLPPTPTKGRGGRRGGREKYSWQLRVQDAAGWS